MSDMALLKTAGMTVTPGKTGFSGRDDESVSVRAAPVFVLGESRESAIVLSKSQKRRARKRAAALKAAAADAPAGGAGVGVSESFADIVPVVDGEKGKGGGRKAGKSKKKRVKLVAVAKKGKKRPTRRRARGEANTPTIGFAPSNSTLPMTSNVYVRPDSLARYIQMVGNRLPGLW